MQPSAVPWVNPSILSLRVRQKVEICGYLSDVEIQTETRNVINDWAQLGLMMAGIFMCSHVQMLPGSSPSWRPLSRRHDVMPHHHPPRHRHPHQHSLVTSWSLNNHVFVSQVNDGDSPQLSQNVTYTNNTSTTEGRKYFPNLGWMVNI